MSAHNALTQDAALGLSAWSHRMASKLSAESNPSAQALGDINYQAQPPAQPGAAPAVPTPPTMPTEAPMMAGAPMHTPTLPPAAAPAEGVLA